MMVVLCIAFGSRSARAEAPVVHGSALVPAGAVALSFEGGMATFFPTIMTQIGVGTGAHTDLQIWGSTHAGLAYGMGIRGRWRPGDGPWSVGGTVDEALFTVEQLGGIASLHAPFGHRTAITPEVAHRRTTRAGVALGTTVGAEIRISSVEDLAAGPARVVEPALDLVWGQIVATWPGEGGRTFVRFRGIVPVAIDFHPLGYLPHIAVGRTWGLR